VLGGIAVTAGIHVGALLLGALLCAGASMEAKTVTRGAPDNHTEVGLILGDTLVVELPSTLSGQYKWVSHLEKRAALNEALVPAKSEGTKKDAGTQQFRYNSVRRL
jgi:hypothetical protein